MTVADENHDAPTELAVLISFSGRGGVERMVLNLLAELARQGRCIDLLTIRAESEHLRAMPAQIRHVPLGARHSLTAVPALRRYLRAHRPPALLAAKDRAGRAALIARGLARVPTRIVIRLGTNLSAALEGSSALKRITRLLPMRLLYRRVDAIVAVSEGVARDVEVTARVPPGRIEVIRNPVITPRLHELARAPAPHEWLGEGHDTPVLLAAGRLTRQKDFATLIRAFAVVRAQQPCRLVILGEGAQREMLEGLARKHDVAPDIRMPGFVDNPYAWMGRADLFVLSSAWEGSPNVLTEAMALGTAVVATDCPSGPREVLQGGRYGNLVPVGDHEALAEAIVERLENPVDADDLREAVADYTAERSAARYLHVLGLD
jgi:glycosyltransferase involved in cell wall biosynthesis